MAMPMLLNSRIILRQGRQAADKDSNIEATQDTGHPIAYPDICALSAEHYNLICLPQHIDRSWVQRNAIFIAQMLDQQRPLLLDFADVEYFEPCTEHLFLQMFRHSTNNHQQVYIAGLNHPQLIRQLKTFRVYDMFRFKVFSSFEKMLFLLGDEQEASSVQYQSRGGIFYITLTGSVEAESGNLLDIDTITTTAKGKPLLVDLSRVNAIDNRGLALLAKLNKLCGDRHQQMLLLGVNAGIHQRFQAAGLLNAFSIADTHEQAMSLLR